MLGCESPDLAGVDSVFYNWDGRVVHCPTEGDTKAGNDLASIITGLDRALERTEVLELLVHQPGISQPMDEFEQLLAAIDARGLEYITFEEMAAGGPPVAGVALQYDGTYVDQWYAGRDVLLQYGAQVTMFVTRYHLYTDEEKALLRVLSEDGHDIEAHAVDHLRPPLYVEEHGLQAYLDNEVLPSIQILRDDGYDVVSYAYPFGDRTSELDRAIAEHIPLIRSLTLTRPFVTSPCPF